MSTRANVVFKENDDYLFYYRHSDGYPDCCGKDLTEFVRGYSNRSMRLSLGQSAGWLIVRGHKEYIENGAFTGEPNPKDSFSGWKCGAYEPTTFLHGDVEYVYVIDLVEKTLKCFQPKNFKAFWDSPSFEFLAPSKEMDVIRFEGQYP